MPAYEVEEHGTDWTFSTTLIDIEKMSANDSVNDWPAWRMKVVDTVRAGEKLERAVIAMGIVMKQFDGKFAPQSSVDGAIMRVEALEEAAKARKSFRAVLTDRLWAVLLLALAAFLGHYFK